MAAHPGFRPRGDGHVERSHAGIDAHLTRSASAALRSATDPAPPRLPLQASLAGRLRRWGYCAHGVDLGGVFGRYNARPIEHIARMIAEQVEELADDHGCERIDVIGHSEGGIGGRDYVQRLNGSRRVSHLVTLGTPHRGTRWAYVGYAFGQLLPSLPQMATGSSPLRD